MAELDHVQLIDHKITGRFQQLHIRVLSSMQSQIHYI